MMAKVIKSRVIGLHRLAISLHKDVKSRHCPYLHTYRTNFPKVSFKNMVSDYSISRKNILFFI